MNCRSAPIFGILSALFSSASALGAGSDVPPRANATKVEFIKIGSADKPVGFVLHPKTLRFYVVEQTGRLREFSKGKAGKVVLDLRKDLSSGNEQGFLGAAFSVDGRWLYTNHTDTKGDTHITAFPFQNEHALYPARRELLKVAQPYSNHNGGDLHVSADDILWIALGDGGSGGDPKGNAQNLNVLLGKILRIQPTPERSRPYTIPPGNLPKGKGREEIWAYGLRNPWRFFLDETSGEVWIGDVGQNNREEVDRVSMNSPTTPNFGWNKREGTLAYESGDRPPEAIEPIYDYPHGDGANDGCSITGGVVTTVGPDRVFLFTDYCRGSLRAIRRNGKVEVYDGKKLSAPSSFGIDATGAVVVATVNGPIYRLIIGT